MRDDLNAVSAAPQAIKVDLVTRAAYFGAVGWIAFGITALVLVAQNIALSVLPKQVMASENGVVVGQVIFDEAKIRADDEILADVKAWVARCTSVNRLSIYEDLAICLNHMDQDLADIRLKQYEKNNYVVTIEKFGCERSAINFDNTKTHIARKDTLSYEITGQVAGDVICSVPGDKPVIQAFAIDLTARLKNKNTAHPLGLEITTFKDEDK